LSPSRRALSRWLQIPACGLLYGLLFPPTQALRSDALTVLTPGSTRAERSGVPRDQALVALPGEVAPVRAEAAADLATALRRHDAVRHLQVLGEGLSARDLPVAAGLDVRFDAAPEHGLVELDAPARANLGWRWRLAGRAAAPVRGVELRDPAGAVADAAALDSSGHFALAAPASAPGEVRYELRLLGEKQQLVDAISVPLVITSGAPLNVLVRAGAVGPELKYWRRWAADAGLQVSLSARLTDGVSLREGVQRLDTDALTHVDVAIVDARAWDAWSATEKASVRAAVEQGMGLLLRADGPLSPGTLADWRALGFALGAAAPRGVSLTRRMGLRDAGAFAAAPVDLLLEEPSVRGASGPTRVSFAADDATPLVWWRATGRGRIGVSRLLDSYRLVLAGQSASYATLWADALGVLARARAAPPPAPDAPRDAWVDERVTVCGLGEAARIVAPDGTGAVTLRVDAAGCAAYWPAEPGWQALETSGTVTSFYVRAADDGATLRTALARRATAALGSAPSHGAEPVGEAFATGMPLRAAMRAPTTRWPWFLAWFGVMSLIWWLERPDLRRHPSRA
jgi:hypothetical protein